MRTMTAGQPRDEYRELFGEESRSGNRQWLLRRCAWRLQALAEGDLTERARARARELARDVDIRVHPPVFEPVAFSRIRAKRFCQMGAARCKGQMNRRGRGR